MRNKTNAWFLTFCVDRSVLGLGLCASESPKAYLSTNGQHSPYMAQGCQHHSHACMHALILPHSLTGMGRFFWSEIPTKRASRHLEGAAGDGRSRRAAAHVQRVGAGDVRMARYDRATVLGLGHARLGRAGARQTRAQRRRRRSARQPVAVRIPAGRLGCDGVAQTGQGAASLMQ